MSDENVVQCLNKVVEDQSSSYIQNSSLPQTRSEALTRVSVMVCGALSST